MSFNARKINFCGKERKFKRCPNRTVKDFQKRIENIQEELEPLTDKNREFQFASQEINDEIETINKHIELLEKLDEPTDEEIRQSLDLNQSKVQLQKELHKLINDNELSMRNEKDFFKDIDKKLMDTYAEFATLIFDKFEFEEFEDEADSTDLVIAPRLSELYRLCTSGAKQAEVDKVYRNIIKDNIESSFQS